MLVYGMYEYFVRFVSCVHPEAVLNAALFVLLFRFQSGSSQSGPPASR